MFNPCCISLGSGIFKPLGDMPELAIERSGVKGYDDESYKK